MRYASALPAFVVALAMLTACGRTGDRSTGRGPHDCHRDHLDTLYKGSSRSAPISRPTRRGTSGTTPPTATVSNPAITYAVADKLGYATDYVRWVRVPFNGAITPGPKPFDANLSECSITEQRKEAVDFSSPYYDVTQAVVTVQSSPAAGVHSVDGLKSLRLGAQVGTPATPRPSRSAAAFRSPSTTPTWTPRWR